MTTRALKRTQPTLSVRVARSCAGCGRRLPQRAYRQTCASCIKLACGRLKFFEGYRDFAGQEHIVEGWTQPRPHSRPRQRQPLSQGKDKSKDKEGAA
jgi:hypothetical protein